MFTVCWRLASRELQVTREVARDTSSILDYASRPRTLWTWFLVYIWSSTESLKYNDAAISFYSVRFLQCCLASERIARRKKSLIIRSGWDGVVRIAVRNRILYFQFGNSSFSARDAIAVSQTIREPSLPLKLEQGVGERQKLRTYLFRSPSRKQ